VTAVIVHLRAVMEAAFREVLSSFYNIITILYSFYVGTLALLEIIVICYFMKKLKDKVLRVQILTKIIPT
jgi:hypothetical protein